MKRLILLFVGIFALTIFANAEIPERPNPPRLVNDFADVFNNSERNQLEEVLTQFARETSTQIVVVTVAGLDGYDKADYAFRLGEKWGVGQKDNDNGLIILLKPKTKDSNGEIFIATGYGLEGVLPDAVLNGAVIDNEMIPRFKQNDYMGGIASGIKVIMDLAREEYTAEQYQESVSGGGGSGIPFAIILFVLIFSIFGGRRRRGRFYSPGRSLPFWLAMGMMSGGSRSSGSFSNFSSGSGSFGGFGGFGGGSFGGGGAGGSW